MRFLFALPILAVAVLFTGCEATVVDDGPHYGHYSGRRYYYDDRPGYYYHGGPAYYSHASYYDSRARYSSPRYGYSSYPHSGYSYNRSRSYYGSNAHYSRNSTVNRTVVNRTNVNHTTVNRTNVANANHQVSSKKKQRAKQQGRIEG
jgi:hypothetical protein